LPFDDFLKAILPLKKAYKSDSITVAITGGEPLLRKDLAECGIKLRQNGFRWGMVTNGYDYTPEIHKKMLAAGMGSITVSLDGLEKNHNWLRGNSQSFERAVNAISLITTSSRLNYDIVTCVNKRNINELEALKEFLIEKKVKAWRLFTISPIGRASIMQPVSASQQASASQSSSDSQPSQINDLCLNPEQLKHLMEFIVEARKDSRIKVDFSCEAYLGKYERKARDAFFFCRAGVQVASILIDGSISACPNINRHFIQGNIYKDDFLDVWNNRFQVMRDRKWTKTGICKNCNAFKNCNGGAMHMWNEKQDEIMCCIHHQIQSL